jgi:microcystin-dependent protein
LTITLKSIIFKSGSSLIMNSASTVHFPDSSKKYIGNNTTTLAASLSLSGGLPKGCIMIWSLPNNIPFGWETCDGNIANGLLKPDLRGLFIIGANGTTYQVGTPGGNVNHSITLSLNNLPSHSHTGTTGVGGVNHTHEYYSGRHDGGNQKRVRRSKHRSGQGYATHSTSHAHTAVSANVGSSSAIDMIPPYYSLIYIIKVL